MAFIIKFKNKVRSHQCSVSALSAYSRGSWKVSHFGKNCQTRSQCLTNASKNKNNVRLLYENANGKITKNIPQLIIYSNRTSLFFGKKQFLKNHAKSQSSKRTPEESFGFKNLIGHFLENMCSKYFYRVLCVK